MEQVEVSKTDVEKKVERILKLIKRRNRAKKEQELVALIEDFHKQFQSLHAQCDHLKRQSGKTAPDGKGNESCSYYASDADSEYYSSEDIEINTANNGDINSQRSMTGEMEEELERVHAEVAELKRQLASKTEEKEALAVDHLAALSKIKEIESINNDLRKHLAEKEKRLSALGKVHKGRVKDLEEQLTGLKFVVESSQHQKRVFEAQLDGKLAESKQQGDEVTKLMKQIKDNEDNMTSKIEVSMAHLSNLKKEVDYLRSKKFEAEESIAGKSNEFFDQMNAMKQELDSLCSEKMEAENMLERKSRDISQYQIQVETLKELLARKNAVEQMMIEEKEGLEMQIVDLESEVDALSKQKTKLENEERKNVREIHQLREEKGHLHAKIQKLEAPLGERGPKLSAFQDDSKRTKEAGQDMTLNSEVEILQQKLDTMKMEKDKLELQLADQQRIAKEREESTNKAVESNSKLVRRLSTGNKFNYQILERKMEDLAQEFRKKLEDNIRILYQRITVAEKIHYENKEAYKNFKERLEQENEALGQTLATYEAEFKKLRDSMEPSKNTSIGSNSVAINSEDDEGNSPTRISCVTDELISSTNDCDAGKEEDGMKQVKSSNVNLLIAEMKEKEKEQQLLKEKVLNLETRLKEEGDENLNLLKTVNELENRVGELEKVKKEKDETLLSLGEEKKEAIRQLCILIEYHRSRCDTLKELISKFNVKIKKKT